MGTLHVVATPLGNLEDLSPRAARVLAEASRVYAEDTRVTRKLLPARADVRSLHAHNEARRIDDALAALAAGDVALVSDAGTPALNDPGARLVAAAHAHGYPVSPVAGPSALAAALSVAGFLDEQHAGVLFAGFPPAQKGRRQALDRILQHVGIVVFYEAPHRLTKTTGELAASQPDRLACLCRELTKRYEEVRRATLAALAATPEPRGECTVVLAPYQLAADFSEPLQRCLAAGLSERDAVAAVAAILGCKKSAVKHARPVGSLRPGAAPPADGGGETKTAPGSQAR
jgi:16S rRNA (cytidine1402-2'-O)-methyltransferase